MNFQEALELSWAKHGGHELPWEISKDTYTVIFQHGWHAHMEALKQPDLFPGTWHKDPVSANEAQRAEHPPCKREAAGSSPAVGSITAADIYAAYPRKVGKGAAIKAIEKAIKKLAPGKDAITHWNPAEALLEQTKEYAAAVATWPKDERKYCPHPATWYNQERYCDDPTEWRRGAAATSQFSKTH